MKTQRNNRDVRSRFTTSFRRRTGASRRAGTPSDARAPTGGAHVLRARVPEDEGHAGVAGGLELDKGNVRDPAGEGNKKKTAHAVPIFSTRWLVQRR